MITFLEGKLETKTPARIEINVGGVGYEVFISLNSYDQLPPPGGAVRIHTHDYVREDARILYGFTSQGERELFLRLIGVSGIGPKIAMSAISGLSLREFKLAVLNGDVKRLSSISGIGKKMAERIIVELRDKMTPGEALEAAAGEDDKAASDVRVKDAVAALVSLGYKQMDAWKMVRACLEKLPDDAGAEELIRRALAS